MKLDTVDKALSALQNGRMVIVIDDENRENEGDLVCAAQFATKEIVNFMANYGRGIICAPIKKHIALNLDLDLMVKNSNDVHQTPFTVSIDLIEGNTTGISAEDRANTLKALSSTKTKPQDFKRPGHIFPLIANDQGLKARRGHTEATIDLLEMAQLIPAGVICEIMNDDGTMARLPDLLKLKEKYSFPLISIQQILNARTQHIKASLPTSHGNFSLHLFEDKLDPQVEHLCLTTPQINPLKPVTVRIHSECLTGDLFKSRRCDCGDQLERSLALIEQSQNGILIYLRQEGRGIGLRNKIKAYQLQEKGHDTVSANLALGFKADLRSYDQALEVLKHFNVAQIKLITNNPAKISAFEGSNIHIVERISISPSVCDNNKKYIQTKKDQLGHLFDCESCLDDDLPAASQQI